MKLQMVLLAPLLTGIMLLTLPIVPPAGAVTITNGFTTWDPDNFGTPSFDMREDGGFRHFGLGGDLGAIFFCAAGSGGGGLLQIVLRETH
jgi:hypothetical protein